MNVRDGKGEKDAALLLLLPITMRTTTRGSDDGDEGTERNKEQKTATPRFHDLHELLLCLQEGFLQPFLLPGSFYRAVGSCAAGGRETDFHFFADYLPEIAKKGRDRHFQR